MVKKEYRHLLIFWTFCYSMHIFILRSQCLKIFVVISRIFRRFLKGFSWKIIRKGPVIWGQNLTLCDELRSAGSGLSLCHGPDAYCGGLARTTWEGASRSLLYSAFPKARCYFLNWGQGWGRYGCGEKVKDA